MLIKIIAVLMATFLNKKLLLPLLIVISIGAYFNSEYLMSAVFDVKSQIAKALIRGDLEKFDQMITAYPGLDYAAFRYERGKNLAHFFNYKRVHSGFVERLSKLRVDFNHLDDDGFNPLMTAVNGEKPRVVRELLKRGASIHAKKEGLLSALEFCEGVVKNFPDNEGCALIFDHRNK